MKYLCLVYLEDEKLRAVPDRECQACGDGFRKSGLLLAAEAQRLGFGIMVGCMLGTSLAMAPAMLLTPLARFVDLDAPLLLARDRDPGLVYAGSLVSPPSPSVWG